MSIAEPLQPVIVYRRWSGRFEVHYGDRIIFKATQLPFVHTARKLLAEGVSPDTPMVLSQFGLGCQITTIGRADERAKRGKRW